jgi:hypothetical protein
VPDEELEIDGEVMSMSEGEGSAPTVGGSDEPPALLGTSIEVARVTEDQ